MFTGSKCALKKFIHIQTWLESEKSFWVLSSVWVTPIAEVLLDIPTLWSTMIFTIADKFNWILKRVEMEKVVNIWVTWSTLEGSFCDTCNFPVLLVCQFSTFSYTQLWLIGKSLEFTFCLQWLENGLRNSILYWKLNTNTPQVEVQGESIFLTTSELSCRIVTGIPTRYFIDFP